MISISLKNLREARDITQADVAASMRVSQPAVSKLERREDVSLAALRDYIAALGGELKVSARFADRVVPLLAGREPAFEMPEDWAAEVTRIRAMSPERRLTELANASAFFASAKRRA